MSSSEPSPERFPYAGWVPTANGRLSFRHLGEAQHPTEAIYANVNSRGRRLVLAYQHRRLSDALFRGLIHYLCDINGDFWFVLSAESAGTAADAEDMAGTIYIYKSKSDWRNRAEERIRGSIYEMNGTRLTLDPMRESILDRCFAAANERASETSDIQISFQLNRSGNVYFSAPSFKDSELEYASVDYARSLKQDFPKWVADQSYFFLRDLTHRHQHHPPSSDTIIILQVRDEAGVRWRRNIIYSLHHYIIRAKRALDAPSQYMAQGTLAYCNSFLEICKRDLGEKISEIPPFNNAALLASLQAKAAEESYFAAEHGVEAVLRVTRAATFRLVAFAAVTLIIAILAILVQPHIDQVPSLNHVGDFVAVHFPEICGVLFLTLVAVWLITHHGWHVRTRFGRDLLEAANVKRVRAIIFFLSSAIVVAAITVWLGWAAIKNLLYLLITLARGVATW